MAENVEPERETCGQLGCGVRDPRTARETRALRPLASISQGYNQVQLRSTPERGECDYVGRLRALRVNARYALCVRLAMSACE